MITTIQHEVYGPITYKENAWTGKKEITINGISLAKQKKNVYRYDNGENALSVTVQGNFLIGVKLVIANETIALTKAAAWYEIACSVAIFVLVLAWGNNAYLCSIFPIIGGAIGGFVSGLMAMLNLWAMKSIKKVGFKLAVALLMLIATVMICFVLAVAFLLLLV